MGVVEKGFVQIVAGEEPNTDAGPGGSERLAAAKRIIDGLAGVLFGPDAGKPCRALVLTTLVE